MRHNPGVDLEGLDFVMHLKLQVTALDLLKKTTQLFKLFFFIFCVPYLFLTFFQILYLPCFWEYALNNIFICFEQYLHML